MFLLVVFVSGLLQATTLSFFGIFGIKPDLLMIAVVAGAVFFNSRWALFLSLFAGFLKDIFAAEAFGINVLLYPAWSCLILRVSRKITIDDNFVLMAAVFIAVFFNSIVMRFINLYLGRAVSLGIFLRITFMESLYSAGILLLFFKPLDYFRMANTYKREEEF